MTLPSFESAFVRNFASSTSGRTRKKDAAILNDDLMAEDEYFLYTTTTTTAATTAATTTSTTALTGLEDTARGTFLSANGAISAESDGGDSDASSNGKH